MRLIFLLELVLFLLCFSTQAIAKLSVFEIFEDGRNKNILDSADNQNEGFYSLSQGYKIYGGHYIFDTDISTKWEVVDKSEGVDLLSSKEGHSLLTGIKGEGQISVKNNKNKVRKFIVRWNPTSEKMFTSNCGKMAPFFVLNKKDENTKNQLNAAQDMNSQDMLFAVHCRLKDKKLYMTVSSTIDVQWSDSSIFESDGKGERWRDYQIPAWTPNGGIIAEIKLKRQNLENVFSLKAPKSQEQLKQEALKNKQEVSAKNFQNEFMISSQKLAFNADPINATDSKFAIGYHLLSPRFFDFIKVGGAFATSLEINKKDDSLTLNEILLFGGYNGNLSDYIELGGYLVYQYADFSQKSTAARVQNSQIGVLLNLNYLVNSENKLKFEVYKTNFGSSVIKEHLSYKLSYHYSLNSFLQNTWLGLFYKDQKFKAVNNSGDERTFNENLMGVSFVF